MNRFSLKARKKFSLYFLVLGLRKRRQPSKKYYFMILVKWNDDTELVISRDLDAFRCLILNLKKVIQPEATYDFGDVSKAFQKPVFFREQTLSVHMKLVEKVSKFLGVVEYYQSLRKSQPSRAFFYNSDADAIDHTSSISYLIIDHTEFSSKQHQRKIRKSVGHFLQTFTKIESTEYEVLEDFTSADNKQVQIKT